MNLTIYYKNGPDLKDGTTYNFSDHEYTRLRDDYEAYLKTGKPENGVYLSRTAADKDAPPETVVTIEFARVSFIDVKVQMDRIDETLRQPPFVKRFGEKE